MNTEEKSQVMEAAAQAALKMTFQHVLQLPSPQVIPYLTNVVLLGVELLRAGGTEDEFVRAFLGGAVDSLDAPPALSFKDSRTN
ncbi:MAG: hypothetical protein ACREPD_06155 [Stenotrophomonas sp.]|uniref:hypothetical protein n=1 Tax=Stenotrophomonas sp. TaxID=69392 RepID=UPI003D6C735E